MAPGTPNFIFLLVILIYISPPGLVRKLSKGRFLTLRYKFGQKWYQTDRVDVSNQDVKKFVLHITLGAAGAQKTA